MSEPHAIKIHGRTDVGRVRDHNEDAVFFDAAKGVALVADGMGGHASGEVASRIAVETFARLADTNMDLSQTLIAAHEAIVAQVAAEPQTTGMGATAVAVLADAARFDVAWVGDSRCYLWRRDGGLQQITHDHSYVDELLRAGDITAEQARTHPQRNVVTQALGDGMPQPDRLQMQWSRGDRLMLCSDGLSDELDDAQIEAILAQDEVSVAVDKLIDAALTHGGRDNISVIVAENCGGSILKSDKNLERDGKALTPTSAFWSILLGCGVSAVFFAAVWYFFLRK